MPITLRCIIENNNVNENVAKFMLPIGSAINMDGTALYEGTFDTFVIADKTNFIFVFLNYAYSSGGYFHSTIT